jgi:hypothetical protein
MEHQLATRSGGVSALGQAQENHAACFQVVHRVDQMAQGSAQPVKSVDDDRVAGSYLVQHGVRRWALFEFAGRLVYEDPLTAGD